MRAIVMESFGEPEVLRPAEVPAAARHRRLEESGSVVGKVILDPTMAA